MYSIATTAYVSAALVTAAVLHQKKFKHNDENYLLKFNINNFK